MSGVRDIVYARKTTKYYLMINGLHSDEIDNMDNEEVILLCEFLQKYEETRTKKLATEIAKAVWGKK